MGKKVHYKLHKVKKQWVTIAVTSAALASIVGGATVANQKVSDDQTRLFVDHKGILNHLSR